MISKSQFGPPWPGAWPRAISDSFIPLQKVIKTPDFFQNPVFFMAFPADLDTGWKACNFNG